MEQTSARRGLVKSPPELWAEVSDGGAPGRRLAQFGEIRITRVEPESTVAWEGDRASGTVQLEAAGWGTQVTLTATPAASPPTVQPPGRERRGPPAAHGSRFLARLLRHSRDAGPAAPAPAAPRSVPAAARPDPEPAASPLVADRTAEILGEMLDDLGAAHHRPYSRD